MLKSNVKESSQSMDFLLRKIDTFEIIIYKMQDRIDSLEEKLGREKVIGNVENEIDDLRKVFKRKISTIEKALEKQEKLNENLQDIAMKIDSQLKEERRFKEEIRSSSKTTKTGKPKATKPSNLDSNIKEIERDMLTEINNLYSLNKKNVQHQKMIYEEVQMLKDDIQRSTTKPLRPPEESHRRTDSIKISNKNELEHAYKSSVHAKSPIKEDLEDFRLRANEEPEMLSDFKSRMRRLREEEEENEEPRKVDYKEASSYSRRLRGEEQEKSRSKSFSSLAPSKKLEMQEDSLYSRERKREDFRFSPFSTDKSRSKEIKSRLQHERRLKDEAIHTIKAKGNKSRIL